MGRYLIYGVDRLFDFQTTPNERMNDRAMEIEIVGDGSIANCIRTSVTS